MTAVASLALASSVAANAGDMTTAAGTGVAGFGGDGGAATAARVNSPTGVAPLSDGSILIADYKNNRVRKVSSAGLITTVAGTGAAGSSGDGGAATAAKLAAPLGVAALSDGGFLIADSGNNRVRKVASSGVITTVAGTGVAGSSGDGGPATGARLSGPTGVAPLSDGGFVIADYKNNRVRKVSSAGVITTVAGTGAAGSSGDGGAATAAKLAAPLGVAALSDGGFLIADSGNNRVRKVASSGVITTVAGTGVAGFGGDGGAATAARLRSPAGVASRPDGSFLIADMLNNRVRAVSVSGVITTVAGSGTAGFAGDGGSAATAQLNAPVGVAVAMNDATLIADSGNNRVRSVEGAPAPTVTTPGTPPAPDAAPANPAPPARDIQVELSSSVTVTKAGVVPLGVSCSADAGARCRGTLTLVVTRRSTHASAARRGQRTLTIARANFSVAPGKKAMLRAHLSRRGRQLLRRKGSLKVTAKISRRGGPNLGQKNEAIGFTIKRHRARKASAALFRAAGSLR